MRFSGIEIYETAVKLRLGLLYGTAYESEGESEMAVDESEMDVDESEMDVDESETGVNESETGVDESKMDEDSNEPAMVSSSAPTVAFLARLVSRTKTFLEFAKGRRKRGKKGSRKNEIS